MKKFLLLVTFLLCLFTFNMKVFAVDDITGTMTGNYSNFMYTYYKFNNSDLYFVALSPKGGTGPTSWSDFWNSFESDTGIKKENIYELYIWGTTSNITTFPNVENMLYGTSCRLIEIVCVNVESWNNFLNYSLPNLSAVKIKGSENYVLYDMSANTNTSTVYGTKEQLPKLDFVHYENGQFVIPFTNTTGVVWVSKNDLCDMYYYLNASRLVDEGKYYFPEEYEFTIKYLKPNVSYSNKITDSDIASTRTYYANTCGVYLSDYNLSIYNISNHKFEKNSYIGLTDWYKMTLYNKKGEVINKIDSSYNANELAAGVIYAELTQAEKYITFTSSELNTIKSDVISLEKSIDLTNLQDYAPEGYTVTGLYYDKNYTQPVTESELNSSNVDWNNGNSLTLYIKTIPTVYKINYHLNGGTNNSESVTKFTVNSPDIKLYNPTKYGYTFKGWYLNDQYEPWDKVSSIKASNNLKNIDLYARWECNHISTIIKNEINSTCIKEGYTGDTYCANCDVLIKNGTTTHLANCNTDIIKDKKDATCCTDGYTGDAYCSSCNTQVNQGSVQKATGEHNITYVGKVDATCTENGQTGDQYCSNSNQLIAHSEVIPATGKHVETIINKKLSTCSESGYTGDIYCTVCKKILTAGMITEPNSNHEYSEEGKIIKAATIEEEGSIVYTCKHCDATKVEAIPKLTVTDEPTVNPDTPSVKPTISDYPAIKPKNPSTDEKQNDDSKDGSDDKKQTSKKPSKVSSLKLKNVAGKKLKVSFKKQSGCKYQIQTSTDKKFKKSVKTYKISKTSYTVKKLKKGNKYYVRVRAYKVIDGKTSYGKWSSVKSITIKK